MGKLVNTGNINYCGKEAQEIFAHDIYDLDLRGYGVRFMDNVKGKQKIYTGDTGDAWQEYTCPFTPDGSANLAEATIEPERIKVNQEECYDAFDGTFLAEQTEITLNGGIPQTFADWYFARLRKKMGKEYQEMFWKGDKTWDKGNKKYLKVVDGVEKQLKDGGAEKITGTAITVTNVLEQVEATIMKAIEKAAELDVATDNYVVFMNKADFDLLKIALGKITVNAGNSTQTVFNNYAKDGETVSIFGYKIVPAEVSKNTIIAGPANNLVLGYDTFDSHLEYRVIDMRETTGDNSFRVLALSNIAVGVVFDVLFAISYVE